jgi:hypothetical protein
MDYQDTYAAMSDSEILNVANDFNSLAEPARIALTAELDRRQLTAADMIQHRQIAATMVAPAAVATPAPTQSTGSVTRSAKWLGKVLLAVLLGCVALVVAAVVVSFLLGAMTALLGLDMPTDTVRNAITLAVLVVALVIYRKRRSRKPAPPAIGADKATTKTS